MWKPLSSDCSICSDHGDDDLWDGKSSIVFAAMATITGDRVSIYDHYDRWPFFSVIARITVIVGIVAFIWKLGFTLTQI